MNWTKQTLFTLLAAAACMVGGAFIVRRSPEAGAALVFLGAGLGGWLVKQPAFSRKDSTDGKDQGSGSEG